jgi:hypothetical protein
LYDPSLTMQSLWLERACIRSVRSEYRPLTTSRHQPSLLFRCCLITSANVVGGVVFGVGTASIPIPVMVTLLREVRPTVARLSAGGRLSIGELE